MKKMAFLTKITLRVSDVTDVTQVLSISINP
jgi:hypothetical protein